MPTQSERAPLVIASNRGPVELRADQKGKVIQHRGGGGLVNVLGPAIAAHDGLWVAAAMNDLERDVATEAQRSGQPLLVGLPEGTVRLRLLDLADSDYSAYYGRISNMLLWFLHHQMFDPVREPVISSDMRADWRAYSRINAQFASACARQVREKGTVLLQDYHLSLAPRMLRKLRADIRIAHFTMIPWADPAAFSLLPGKLAAELIDGMLGADMLGFHVPRWANAFLACCLVAGYQVDFDNRTVADGDRTVAVRCFPVGVNGDLLSQRMASPRTARLRADLSAQVGDRRLVVRVDRMEPSKNIVRGLDGYAELLQRDRRLHGKVVHYAIAYESRSSLPPYQTYHREVRQRVEEINRRFGTPGWQPVVLETRNDADRGFALMSLADVLVVNPLRDGMNLVAKEGPVVSERDLALVLSTEAGAADDLADAALMVHPFDVTALAYGIADGLDMPRLDRASRLERLRKGACALPPEAWLDETLAELDEVALPTVSAKCPD